MGSRGPLRSADSRHKGGPTIVGDLTHQDDGRNGPAKRLADLRALWPDVVATGDTEAIARLERCIGRLESELGATPLARARMNLPAEPKVDPLEEWLTEVNG